MPDFYPFVHECKPTPYAMRDWSSGDTNCQPPPNTPLNVRCIVCGRVLWQQAELTDQEIVAACARAMGMKPFLQCEHLPLGGFYNPLTDRAQAMELVIRLGMCIEPNGFPPVSWTLRGWMCTKRAWNTVTNKDLLRAICLCAARVQLEKEKGNG